MSIAVDRTNAESVLNKLSKPELAQLLINTWTNMHSHIHLLDHICIFSYSYITANNIFTCLYFEYTHEYLTFEYLNIRKGGGWSMYNPKFLYPINIHGNNEILLCTHTRGSQTRSVLLTILMFFSLHFSFLPFVSM